MAFAERFWTTHFSPLTHEEAAFRDDVRALITQTLGAATTGVLWIQGAHLSVSEAVFLALGEKNPRG